MRAWLSDATTGYLFGTPTASCACSGAEHGQQICAAGALNPVPAPSWIDILPQLFLADVGAGCELWYSCHAEAVQRCVKGAAEESLGKEQELQDRISRYMSRSGTRRRPHQGLGTLFGGFRVLAGCLHHIALQSDARKQSTEQTLDRVRL